MSDSAGWTKSAATVARERAGRHRTVDLLYAAALDRQLWPTALDRLAEQTGGIGTAVLSVSQIDEQALASRSLHEAAAD